MDPAKNTGVDRLHPITKSSEVVSGMESLHRSIRERNGTILFYQYTPAKKELVSVSTWEGREHPSYQFLKEIVPFHIIEFAGRIGVISPSFFVGILQEIQRYAPGARMTYLFTQGIVPLVNLEGAPCPMNTLVGADVIQDSLVPGNCFVVAASALSNALTDVQVVLFLRGTST